jgi:hypothetical protein
MFVEPRFTWVVIYGLLSELGPEFGLSSLVESASSEEIAYRGKLSDFKRKQRPRKSAGMGAGIQASCYELQSRFK